MKPKTPRTKGDPISFEAGGLATPLESPDYSIQKAPDLLAGIKPPFSGVARSIQCMKNYQGTARYFPEFRIVTLTIDQGQIIDTHYSQSYAAFEVLIKFDELMRDDTIHLQMNYEDGKAWVKK